VALSIREPLEYHPEDSHEGVLRHDGEDSVRIRLDLVLRLAVVAPRRDPRIPLECGRFICAVWAVGLGESSPAEEECDLDAYSTWLGDAPSTTTSTAWLFDGSFKAIAPSLFTTESLSTIHTGEPSACGA